MNIFVIVCTVILGTLTITGGKKQAGLTGKGLFYLITSAAFLTLGILILHIHAALVTSLVFCIVFCITLVMAFNDTEKEKKQVDDLREKLEKARRK